MDPSHGSDERDDVKSVEQILMLLEGNGMEEDEKRDKPGRSDCSTACNHSHGTMRPQTGAADKDKVLQLRNP